MKYAGQTVKLSSRAEAIATYWCSTADTFKGMPNELQDVFINHFWSVFSSVLPKDTPIKEFSKCDFTAIAEHLSKATCSVL